MGINKNFWNRNSTTQEIARSINGWNYVKLKYFIQKKKYQQWKQSTKLEKILANYASERVLFSRIYKEQQKINTKQMKLPVNSV